MLNKPAVLEKLAQAATASFGGGAQVSVVTGTPTARSSLILLFLELLLHPHHILLHLLCLLKHIHVHAAEIENAPPGG